MILLTGATGYVGAALRAALEQRALPLLLAGRNTETKRESSWIQYDLAGIEPPSDALFAGVSCVVHCAGLAHRHARESDFRRVNVEGAVRLAKAAVDAGVAHFVYVSSMNVVPVHAPSPQEAAEQYPEPPEGYAASKWRAEQALTELYANSSCMLTIVRPGLVYDTEFTANLRTIDRLLRWWPFALPAVGRRCMVGRADLVDLLVSCALCDAGSPIGEGIISATDGECYDAQRISRALSMTSKWGVMPRWMCRVGGALLDWREGYPIGTSWQGLSVSHWCGIAPAIRGWRPLQTLESRSMDERSAA